MIHIADFKAVEKKIYISITLVKSSIIFDVQNNFFKESNKLLFFIFGFSIQTVFIRLLLASLKKLSVKEKLWYQSILIF